MAILLIPTTLLAEDDKLTQCLDKLNKCDAIVISGDEYISRLEDTTDLQRAALERSNYIIDQQRTQLAEAIGQEATWTSRALLILSGAVVGALVHNQLQK